MSPQLLPLPHSEWVQEQVQEHSSLALERKRQISLKHQHNYLTKVPYPSTQLHYYPSHSAPRSVSISSMATPTEEQLMHQSVVEYELSVENPLHPDKYRSQNYFITLNEICRRFPIMQADNFEGFLKLYKARQVTTPTNAGCDSLLTKCRWWSSTLIQALKTRDSS